MAQIIKFSDIVAAQKSQQTAVNADHLQDLTRVVINQNEAQAANQENFIEGLNKTLMKGFDKVSSELKSLADAQSKLASAAEQGSKYTPQLASAAEQGSKYTPQSAMEQIKGGIKQVGSVEGLIDVENSTGLIGNALKRRKARKEFIAEQMEMDTSLTGTDAEKKTILTERFKQVEQLRSQSSINNTKVEKLRERGYSEQQIERTVAGKEIKRIDEQMQMVDPLYKERGMQPQVDIDTMSPAPIPATSVPMGSSQIQIKNVAANDPSITSEEIQQDALKVQETIAKENLKVQTDVFVVLRQQEDIMKKVEENTRALVEKQDESNSEDDSSIDVDLDRRNSRTGRPTSRAGKAGKAGRIATAARAVAPIAGTLIAANVGDFAAGQFGVGKDEEGNDLVMNAEQDDNNWEKMSTFQKIQSGLARGIEKTGSFIGMDNIARQAQAERIKNETQYLQRLEPAQSPSMANVIEGQSIEVGSAKQAVSSAPVMINAPQNTNINNNTSNFSGKPATRNTESTISDLNRSRYRFA